MKKFLLVLFGITTMFGFNKVNAAEFRLDYTSSIEEINHYISLIGDTTVYTQVNSLIDLYYSDYASDYSYFYISLSKLGYPDDTLVISLSVFSSLIYEQAEIFTYTDYSYSYYFPRGNNYTQISYKYDFEANKFTLYDSPGFLTYHLFRLADDDNVYRPYSYYYSNFDFYYKGSIYKSLNLSSSFYASPDDKLFIPKLNNPSAFSVYNIGDDFLIEPYYLYDSNSSLKDDVYTTIDLNEYEYVALSLKDYNTIPESNMSSYTYFYVKGQLCITPVYNYGLTERKDILTGTQIEGCSQYYDDFTANKVFILKDDVINHAIYYVKAYDTSKENIIKIDSNKFDITYITEETKDNPQVIIGGKIYPTLSYDSLTDTSTKSEEEGYVPGVSCTLGDLNCYIENNPENIFDEIFSSPLKFMQDIWDSVTSIFNVIVEFISLLPPQMQSFLYLSFMVAIILGLLKIIL